jgi:hypothetical protein
MAEVFDHGAFGLILHLDMPTFLRLGPQSLNHTVLELDVFHAAPLDGATLVVGEYLRAFNIAGSRTSEAAFLGWVEIRDAYNRDQLGFPSQEYV